MATQERGERDVDNQNDNSHFVHPERQQLIEESNGLSIYTRSYVNRDPGNPAIRDPRLRRTIINENAADEKKDDSNENDLDNLDNLPPTGLQTGNLDHEVQEEQVINNNMAPAAKAKTLREKALEEHRNYLENERKEKEKVNEEFQTFQSLRARLDQLLEAKQNQDEEEFQPPSRKNRRISGQRDVHQNIDQIR